jgi:hypothetical protein
MLEVSQYVTSKLYYRAIAIKKSMALAKKIDLKTNGTEEKTRYESIHLCPPYI